MKSEEWKTYRTRFLVKSKQLSSALSFVDHLGRQHCGRKGDYLVESFDGVLSIAPRRIFEDIYVPMSQLGEPENGTPPGQTPFRQTFRQTKLGEPKLDRQKFEPLEFEEIKLPKSPNARQRMEAASLVGDQEAERVRRKLPQPCRLRPSSSGLGLM